MPDGSAEKSSAPLKMAQTRFKVLFDAHHLSLYDKHSVIDKAANMPLDMDD